MCVAIANVVGWLKYTTIYIITTVYTIAYTWVHTLVYVWYCSTIITTTIVWVKHTLAVYYYYSVAYVVQNTIIVNYM